MNKYKAILSGLAVAAGMSLATVSSDAAITGQRINPNVLLIIDTGRGMDWVETIDATISADKRQTETIAACKAMNDLNVVEARRTSWQQMLDAFLGTIPVTPTNNLHCFYEEPLLRPAIKSDTITGNVSENTEEYWKLNSVPHFRAINCYDPRDPTDRGDWDVTTGQCLGKGWVSTDFQVMSNGALCKKFIDGVANYVAESGSDKEICYNLHPAALPRSADGILERYRSLARFGVMTFDNKPAPAYTDLPGYPNVNAWDGMWDFGRNRNWYIIKYQEGGASTATRWWNAGARGDYSGAVGRLIRISDDFENSNQQVREVLDTVEPLHCSFDAAMMDDIGHYLHDSKETRPAYNSGADLYFNCRPKMVIYITDGIQTDSVEFPQNYCDKNGKPIPAPWETQPAPTDVYPCPFNSSFTETSELFKVVKALQNDPLKTEPVYLVVIGLNMDKKKSGVGPCDAAPTWATDPVTKAKYCKPPSDVCIVTHQFTEEECKCTTAAATCISFRKDNILSPRQYLNQMALIGWPDLGTDTTYATSILKQPAWRSADGSALPIWNFCSDSATLPDSSCGGEDSEGTKKNGALFAYSGKELAMILDTVLQSITDKDATATRTELVTSDIMDAADITGSWSLNQTDPQQYVFNTGYMARGGVPWNGYLFREGYTCEADGGGSAATGTPLAYHDELKLQGAANRMIYALNPKKTNADVNYVGANCARFQKGYDESDVLAELKVGSYFDDCSLGAPGSPDKLPCLGKSDYLKQVIAHLKGEANTERANHMLADIYNSSPSILPPPLERVPIDSYQDFKAIKHSSKTGTNDVLNFAREPMLYVGTNDGILHSFHVWGGTNHQVESWGFVPTPLLSGIDTQFPVGWEETRDPVTNDVTNYTVPALADQTGGYQHTFGVDGSPISADVLLREEAGTNAALWWRSLVVGGLGKGGYGYYALDVTDGPARKPNYRWELSHDRFGGNTTTAQQDALKEMGLPISRPKFAYVWIDSPQMCASTTTKTKHQEAAVILPGGYVSDEDGGASKSTGVYIVRAATGEIFRYLKTSVDADLCDNQELLESNLFKANPDFAKTAQLVGEPVVVNNIATGTVATEAFIGDDRGRLWRIDMSDPDPKEWCLDLYFSSLIAEHFPTRDCLNTTNSTNKCCDAKEASVSNSCLQSEIDLYLSDNKYGIDACTGAPCSNLNYPFPRVPILAPPTVVQDDERNTVLIFGTGQIDGLETLNHNRVFSLTVEPEITKAKGLQHKTPEINWWLGEPMPSPLPLGNQPTGLGLIETDMQQTSPDKFVTNVDTTNFTYFGLGEKMLGRASIFDGVAYFTTFTPMDKGMVMDSCEAGGSKVWAVNYNDPTKATFAKMPDYDNNNPTKMVSYLERPDELLTGIRIVRRPSCEGAEGFVAMVQKARPDALTPTPSGKADNNALVTSESIKIKPSGVGFARVSIDSWSLVFDGE